MIERFPDSEIRSYCRSRIEALEFWLRRLIDETLTRAYGDYFNSQDAHGDRIIKKDLVGKVDQRLLKEPDRYSRRVDAIRLDDAMSILCKEQLWERHFREALKRAFPEGRKEAETFMSRLLDPRNRLSHANSISIHDAERVICYISDVIDSIKQYYVEKTWRRNIMS